jgi:hypothetical protein
MGQGAREYRRWTWGLPHHDVKEWSDKVLDKHLGKNHEYVACGRLCELHFTEPGKQKQTIIRLNTKQANNSLLMFDPDHPNQRLYFKLDPSVKKMLKKRYLTNPKYSFMQASKAASIVGGRHGRKSNPGQDYPKVEVMPIGMWDAVVYAVEKNGDGFSKYIHQMGEESGLKPALGLSHDGSLYALGGNYTCPTAGITD